MKRNLKNRESEVYESIAKSLREFGYPDVTDSMIRDTHAAMNDGKRKHDLPHGIVGVFAASQLNEAAALKLITISGGDV